MQLATKVRGVVFECDAGYSEMLVALHIHLLIAHGVRPIIALAQPEKQFVQDDREHRLPPRVEMARVVTCAFPKVDTEF